MASLPSTVAWYDSPVATTVTVMVVAPRMTWALVSTVPVGEMTMPEPAPRLRSKPRLVAMSTTPVASSAASAVAAGVALSIAVFPARVDGSRSPRNSASTGMTSSAPSAAATRPTTTRGQAGFGLGGGGGLGQGCGSGHSTPIVNPPQVSVR